MLFAKSGLFKPLDILIIILAAALTLLIGARVYSGSKASSRVIIRSQEKTWIYPMDAEAELFAAGPLGETMVKISKGRAAIVSSPCSGQTCVAAGALHKSGQWAACLPNRVFLLVEGGEGAVDAASW